MHLEFSGEMTTPAAPFGGVDSLTRRPEINQQCRTRTIPFSLMPLTNGRRSKARPTASEYDPASKTSSRSISLNAIGCKRERNCLTSRFDALYIMLVVGCSQEPKVADT